MASKISDHNPGKLGKLLQTNTIAKIGELILVFLAGFLFIKIMTPWSGENLVLTQAVIWIANIIMLTIVWLGLMLRGEHLSDFGLSFRFISWKKSLNIFLLSLLVFALAIIGFILGSIIMANITGIPEGSDMSGYDYLKGNIGMFLLTLIGVLIVSSLGEEIIYRAFLINRISQLGLDSKWGRIVAVIISSIIFGLVHYKWGAMGMVQTGFMGLALGFSYILLKKRLIILILAHAYMDTILMMQMYLQNN